MKKSYLIFIVASFLFTACDNYLDVTPKGELIPEKLEDFDLLLNGGNLSSLTPLEVEYCSDNIYYNFTTENSKLANLYFWRPDIDITAESNDIATIWQNSYRFIYYANVIINKVMDASTGTELEKQSLLAEASVSRAVSYFNLLTVFSNAYDPSVNPNDLGIPLVTAIDVTEPIPARASLKESFDLIISDLKNAIDVLPEIQTYRWRVTKYGAAAILARVYLYIQDYENANTYASLALESPESTKVIDYLTLTTSTLPKSSENTEKIWLDNKSLSNNYYSQDLLDLYDRDNDTRITLFTSTNASTGLVNRPRNRNNTAVSYPEMYLIQAEYLARTGQIEDAMDIINMIRAKRIAETAGTIELVATNQEEAMTMVLEERRRELAYTGLRWYDMKRLDQDGIMPVVHRYLDNDNTGTVLESLQPNSTNYTFEIPLKIRLINPNLKLNF